MHKRARNGNEIPASVKVEAKVHETEQRKGMQQRDTGVVEGKGKNIRTGEKERAGESRWRAKRAIKKNYSSIEAGKKRKEPAMLRLKKKGKRTSVHGGEMRGREREVGGG